MRVCALCSVRRFIISFSYFFSNRETITNIRDGNDPGDDSDADNSDGTQATATQVTATQATATQEAIAKETDEYDPVFGNLEDFLSENVDSSRMFKPISPAPSVMWSPTTTTTTTPASSVTHASSARSTKKRRTAPSSLADEYVDAMAEKNDAQDEKFFGILSGLVQSKTSKVEELTATERVIGALAKIVITFPMKDQLDMTSQISQIVHERAMEIETRPNPM